MAGQPPTPWWAVARAYCTDRCTTGSAHTGDGHRGMLLKLASEGCTGAHSQRREDPSRYVDGKYKCWGKLRGWEVVHCCQNSRNKDRSWAARGLGAQSGRAWRPGEGWDLCLEVVMTVGSPWITGFGYHLKENTDSMPPLVSTTWFLVSNVSIDISLQ